MCLGKTPKMPAVPEPTRPQESKQPAQGAFGSTATARKKAQAGGGAAAAGTLLTGPSGIENSQLSLGKSTLLGA
jgi:hypothetical protein